MKSGWVTKKLGEVCDFLGDGDWIESKDQSSRGIRLIQTGNVGQGCFIPKENNRHYISESTFDRLHCTEIFAGDILVSRLPEPVGRACLIPECEERMITAVDCSILRLDRSLCNDKFIVYYASSARWFSDIEAKCTGSTRKRISRKNLQNIDIPIPPLAEQKRIVAKIDAAFEKIDALKANAERNLANAKELFQSALDEAMRPKKGWVEKQLGEVANIRVGPFGSSLHKADYVENGVPLVNPCHMKDSKIADRISTQVSHDKAESLKEYRLKAGDIVFARRGEIGRLAFVSEKEDGYLCGTGSLFARFKERYDIQFLYFLFSSKSFVEKVDMLSSGTTMKSINSSALESMCFSVPPMNEQRRLAKQLDSLSQKTETLHQNYAQQIADCAEMRQAILREAFEGRISTN